MAVGCSKLIPLDQKTTPFPFLLAETYWGLVQKAWIYLHDASIIGLILVFWIIPVKETNKQTNKTTKTTTNKQKKPESEVPEKRETNRVAVFTFTQHTEILKGILSIGFQFMDMRYWPGVKSRWLDIGQILLFSLPFLVRYLVIETAQLTSVRKVGRVWRDECVMRCPC